MSSSNTEQSFVVHHHRSPREGFKVYNDRRFSCDSASPHTAREDSTTCRLLSSKSRQLATQKPATQPGKLNSKQRDVAMVVASPKKVECNLPLAWPAVRVSMTKERCMKHECEHRSPGHGAYSKGEGHAAGPDNHKPAPGQTASRAPPGLDSATCYTNMLRPVETSHTRH